MACYCFTLNAISFIAFKKNFEAPRSSIGIQMKPLNPCYNLQDILSRALLLIYICQYPLLLSCDWEKCGFLVSVNAILFAWHGEEAGFLPCCEFDCLRRNLYTVFLWWNDDCIYSFCLSTVGYVLGQYFVIIDFLFWTFVLLCFSFGAIFRKVYWICSWFKDLSETIFCKDPSNLPVLYKTNRWRHFNKCSRINPV